MNTRNTAGKLGFIRDSEGVYRRGNFVFKNGKIMRESQIVPEGTIEDLKDDFITLDECIRSILSYSTTIGDVNPRATNVYIDKVGNNYKPMEKKKKNTVAVVMSNRQVMELKPRDILDQDDKKELENKDKEDKPIKAKTIKDFSKPTEYDKLKKESDTKKIKKLKLKESASFMEEMVWNRISEYADPEEYHLDKLTDEDVEAIAKDLKDLWDRNMFEQSDLDEIMEKYAYLKYGKGE